MPKKANPTMKERSRKRGAVGASGDSGSEMILALLRGLLGGLRVRDDWLQPGGFLVYAYLMKMVAFYE